MSLDLKLLVGSVALAFAQMLVAVLGATGQVGLPKLAGNRDDPPEIESWAGRANRAHRNMLENLVLFAALVLMAHVAGRANAMRHLAPSSSSGRGWPMRRSTWRAFRGCEPAHGPCRSSA